MNGVQSRHYFRPNPTLDQRCLKSAETFTFHVSSGTSKCLMTIMFTIQPFEMAQNIRVNVYSSANSSLVTAGVDMIMTTLGWFRVQASTILPSIMSTERSVAADKPTPEQPESTSEQPEKRPRSETTQEQPEKRVRSEPVSESSNDATRTSRPLGRPKKTPDPAAAPASAPTWETVK